MPYEGSRGATRAVRCAWRYSCTNDSTAIAPSATADATRLTGPRARSAARGRRGHRRRHDDDVVAAEGDSSSSKPHEYTALERDGRTSAVDAQAPGGTAEGRSAAPRSVAAAHAHARPLSTVRVRASHSPGM